MNFFHYFLLIMYFSGLLYLSSWFVNKEHKSLLVNQEPKIWNECVFVKATTICKDGETNDKVMVSYQRWWCVSLSVFGVIMKVWIVDDLNDTLGIIIHMNAIRKMDTYINQWKNKKTTFASWTCKKWENIINNYKSM